MEEFDEDKFIYLGKFVGEELYADKEISHMGYMGVGQKLKNGKFTGSMTILSKDKNRVNFFDRFTISADFTNELAGDKKFHKEFIKILKTMKIEKIERYDIKIN